MKFSNKEARKQHQQLTAAGWTIVRTGKHPKYMNKDGKSLFVSGTPSDRRAVKNNLMRAARLDRQVA